jgi:hypothetical protein
MIVFRTFLLVCALSGIVMGQTGTVKNNYRQIDLKELIKHPADYQGHLVTITADIISVNADYKSVDVFDSQSKALIGVSTTQLSRTQRQSLVTAPVHRVSISGRIRVKNGRAMIKAEKVTPLGVGLVAKQ